MKKNRSLGLSQCTGITGLEIAFIMGKTYRILDLFFYRIGENLTCQLQIGAISREGNSPLYYHLPLCQANHRFFGRPCQRFPPPTPNNIRLSLAGPVIRTHLSLACKNTPNTSLVELPSQHLILYAHLIQTLKAFINVVFQYYRFFFFIVCFTSYFVFSIAVLPHGPGVVYYHLLLRRETIIHGVAPFSFK